ncbi:N-acetylmannosamine-6-phosphate 2-epimerase [Spelaeicoccus albus]|uniref:Putative N-acetylmannosamine-6-phosphate 2-epimerase n=1 Tax=Spelaeicoccus albus TaxID=1280376 RepID=A0A7Z0IHE0_9MICO|nr:N-acetylmannosamine-6-phosphate 2-epimerase [Spelaeicoccus albus]NYI67507.1 N-acylglucosamine-6-phosphate 2-epimerase [Spelaeicoccus albus]
MTESTTVFESLRGGLIVSCQAYPGEPMRHAETMTQVAEAAVAGGAVGIRAQGLADIALIHERVRLPQIGLWKDGNDDVFITPTLRHALAVAEAGAEVVALDGTRRRRPDGLTLAETLTRLRTETNALIMADCGSLDDAMAAEQAGADCVGTTLSGYSGERPKLDGPDLELIEQIAGSLSVPVIAEGRIHTPAQAAAAKRAGAHAVVVGTAITHPTTITSWFTGALAD